MRSISYLSLLVVPTLLVTAPAAAQVHVFTMQFGDPSQSGTIRLIFDRDHSAAELSATILGTDTASQKAQEIANAIPLADPLLRVLSVSGPTVVVSDSTTGSGTNSFMGVRILSDPTFEQNAIILPFHPGERYRAFRDFTPSSVVPPAGLELTLAVSDTKAFGVLTDGVKTADQIQSDITTAFLNFTNIHWTPFSDAATGEQGLVSDPIDESAAAAFMGAAVSSPDYTRYLGTIGVEIVPEPAAMMAPTLIFLLSLYPRRARRQ
jgi:hypothetical protein